MAPVVSAQEEAADTTQNEENTANPADPPTETENQAPSFTEATENVE